MRGLIPKSFWDFDEDWNDFFGGPLLGRKLVRSEKDFMRTAPKMDIYEKDGKIVAEIELPGVSQKDVEVEIKDNCLTVEAKKEEEKEEKKKGYYRKETASGYLKRQVFLPEEVKADKAEAELKDGVLKVVIPKVTLEGKEKKGVKIKIKNTK